MEDLLLKKKSINAGDSLEIQSQKACFHVIFMCIIFKLDIFIFVKANYPVLENDQTSEFHGNMNKNTPMQFSGVSFLLLFSIGIYSMLSAANFYAHFTSFFIPGNLSTLSFKEAN